MHPERGRGDVIPNPMRPKSLDTPFFGGGSVGRIDKIVEKVRRIKAELNGYFVEREEEIDVLLTALVARQHVLFLGPPGTAKSYLIRSVASHVEGCRYFEWLLTKFSTPEELFGPYDLNKLREGKYERVTTNKLPEAHIAFVDEVFKASSAILNTLLTIMADRKFHNDGTPRDVPLISLISASNELPEEDEPLQALYDRFLLRKTVEYVKSDENLEKLLDLPDVYTPVTKITLDELVELQNFAKGVSIDGVKQTLVALKRELRSNGIEVSDRRFRWSVYVVKAVAALDGRKSAKLDDLYVLQYVFWEDPKQIPTVKSVVLDTVNPYAKKAAEIMAILDDFERDLDRLCGVEDRTVDDANRIIEIHTKLANLKNRLVDLIKQARSEGKPTEDLERVYARVKGIMKKTKKALGFED